MPAEDDYKRFEAFADEMELEDEDGDDAEKKHRSKFISQAMERKGYIPKIVWSDPEPDAGKGKSGSSSSMFGPKRSGGEGKPQRKSGQYE